MKFDVSESPPAAWLERARRYDSKDRSGVHVTDLITCPRKKMLAAEGAEPDGGSEATTWGSALHELVGTQEVPVSMTLGGVEVTGSADAVLDGRVIDYKFPNTDSFYWIVKGKAPKPEHVWQVECYRLGLGDTIGGAITYGAHSSGKWPNWLTFSWDSPAPTEDEVLAFQPHDSPYTVGAILKLYAQPLDTVPLVGETMRFGKEKTMCDYCEFATACRLRASAAPKVAAF